MIVRVADIPPEGLRVDGPETFPQPFQDPSWTLVGVGLSVEKEGEAVLVTGGLEARVPQHCSRCLDPYVTPVTAEINARFVPGGGPGAEHELAADDLETDVYLHGEVDLAALLETETTLALPMKPLCRPECRGLCPVCGGNRNLIACSCEERPTDPRWAALRSWAARRPS
jgi:uncharacterized protein